MTTLSARSRMLLGASTVLATLLYSIDATIINVALPNIQGSLQATQDQTAWVATAYIVVSAIMTPLCGWLGLRYGLRGVLLIAIVGFTVCSVLCGIATTLAEMVLFRALQGAFGAALLPLSQVLLLQEFPRESHVKVMAMWATASMLGPIIGPTLGGYLTDTLSWRWAFYVNVPIGMLAWLALTAALKKSQTDSRRPFDLTGFILLSSSIGLFQLMLDRGQSCDWFNSTEIVAEAFFSAVFLYMFIAHAHNRLHAFVDLHLFRDRNFAVCVLIQTAVGAFLMSPGVLLPTFLQQLQGYSASQAGTLMAARGLGFVLAMLVASRISPRIDARFRMLAGALLVSGTLWEMASFSIDTPASALLVTGILLGVGMPLTFIPMQVIAYSTLPDSSRTEAGVMLRLAMSIGGSVGISLTIAELARSAQINHSYLSEYFTPYATDRWQAIGSNPGTNQATGELIGEISRQALAIAYAHDFRLLALTALVCVPLILMLRPSEQRPANLSAADVVG